MAHRARPWAVAAAVAMLWQAICAQSSEVCTSGPKPEPGSNLLQVQAQKQRVVLDVEDTQSANASAKLALNYSTSTTYCRQQDSALFGNCWAQKPPSSTAACTTDSGTTACRCAGVSCHVDVLHQDPPTTGRCASKTIYVFDGAKHVNQDKAIDVTGTKEEVYCTNMVKNDQWKVKHLVKLSSDGPASKSPSWWWCGSGYTLRDGKCLRKTRYLGESCWDSSWSFSSSGVCAGSDTSYDEYSTSCYKGTCIPFAWAEERHRCDCAWFGWHLIFLCSASGGSCGGHVCSWNTGDGNRYCDYSSAQNW